MVPYNLTTKYFTLTFWYTKQNVFSWNLSKTNCTISKEWVGNLPQNFWWVQTASELISPKTLKFDKWITFCSATCVRQLVAWLVVDWCSCYLHSKLLVAVLKALLCFGFACAVRSEQLCLTPFFFCFVHITTPNSVVLCFPGWINVI